jgi:carbonic anhydrase
VTSSIESFDKAIISRQPNFNDRKIRSEFRKVIPNLKTVVVHCFDPRVTGGIPTAVAKALPGQIYPGEVFEFVGEGGKKNMGSNTTIFPVVVAGGRASASAQLSISIACHLFDIDNVVIVHHTDCGGTTLRLRASSRLSRRNSDRTSPTCGMPTTSALRISHSRCIAMCGPSVTHAAHQGM